MDHDTPEQQYTEFGVYVPLTQREYFTSAVFSSSDYFARLGNRILTPLIISGRAQQQQALEQQKQHRGGGHARSTSASLAASGVSIANAVSAKQQPSPSEVAESLVDLHEEALEMLEKARLDEQQRLVELEKACAIAESSVRRKLSRTRDEHCVSSVGTLNAMENLANAALTVTSGARAEMAAASNRIARGQHVLQLFEIFDACTTMDEMAFQDHLAQLDAARNEAREAVLTAWRIGSASTSASSPLAAISAAAIHGQLFFQSPSVFMAADNNSGESAKAPALKLEQAEQDAINAGMPSVLARRSQVPEALEILRKLVPLAEAMKDEIPLCQNIIEYDAWFRQQLGREIVQLMMKFCDLHGVVSSVAALSVSVGGGNVSGDDDVLETKSVSGGGGSGGGTGTGGAAAAGSIVGSTSGLTSRLTMLRAVAAKSSSSSNPSGSDAGSKDAERQAESRRLILLSSKYAKLLMASLDFVSRLHSVHHESPDTLVMTLRQFIVSDLNVTAAQRYPISHAPPIKGTEFSENAPASTTTAAAATTSTTASDASAQHRGEESTADPNVLPDDRVRLNSREAAAAYDYFLFELLWDLTMIEAMFGSSYPGVRTQVSLAILQEVVRDFSTKALEKSEARRVALLGVVDKINSNQARYFAEKIIAELNYHNEFLAIIVSHVQRIHASIVAKFDDLRDPLRDAFAPVFAFGDTYAKEEYELRQLTRLLKHQTEFHLRDFAVAPDGSAYDLVPAHEETIKQGFDAAETALKRANLICRSKTVANVSTKLAAAFQSYVAMFVERELQKACDMLRKEAYGWNTWPQRMPPGFFTENSPVPTSFPGAPAFTTTGGPKISIMEPLFCSMRLCRWGLSSLARLSRFMQLHLAPTLASNPELVTAWITERTRITSNADRVGAELLTFIAAGTSTRSLALLSFLQDASDFTPSETGTTADLGSRGTFAALHYQHFLQFALQEAEPLLQQIHAAATAEQDLKTSAWDRQRQEAILASRKTGDALRRILKDSKICSASFVLNIGYGLFKGLCCHLRAHPVNDIGVLIMKRDVAIYRNAANLLFKHSTSEENFALSELFDVLKELMNLLMVPLDNIRNVKSTGLLKELHQKDIVEFLQMRQDIGKALSDSLKL